MIIAIDGVDRTGKTTLSHEFSKYGYRILSAELFRLKGHAPIGMRQWADVPILSMLQLFDSNAVLDRSLISVLAYNIDSTKPGNSQDIFLSLMDYVPWYKQSVHFVYYTYNDVNTILNRDDDHSKSEIEEDNECFQKVYEICGISPLKIYSENSIYENVEKILSDVKI